MKALAQIGAWHNSLDRMPVVILVSPLLNYFTNYRKETENATQMGKKAHLDLARSGLFVSEIADAEREREKFLHLSF